jgi:Ca2+-binding EF-hand superfamily protein
VVHDNKAAAESMRKVSEIAIRIGVDFADKFKEFDLSNQGSVSRQDFERIVYENVSLETNEMNALLDLIAPKFQDRIFYHDFLQILYRFGEKVQNMHYNAGPPSFAGQSQTHGVFESPSR